MLDIVKMLQRSEAGESLHSMMNGRMKRSQTFLLVDRITRQRPIPASHAVPVVQQALLSHLPAAWRVEVISHQTRIMARQHHSLTQVPSLQLHLLHSALRAQNRRL